MVKVPSFEVIVVDQNGDDRLVKQLAIYAQHMQIKHERVFFKGGSRARNHGALVAKGQWLGFPDDDCELLPDVLQQVELLSADERLQVITGRTIDSEGQSNVLRWGSEQHIFDRWSMFGCLTEATLFVKRDCFLSVDGFDERFGPGARFPAAEGIDLMNRLFSCIGSGLALYSPTVKMRHPTKIPPWNPWAVRRFYDYARGDGALIAKSFSPHLLNWGLRTFASAMLQIVRLQGWKSLAYAARVTGLIIGFCAYCIRPS
jgi:glycosyltransferase involved in cell wall biosynthesis